MGNKSKNRIIPDVHHSHLTTHLSAPSSQNGITLIALVVTIIILLLLAGVTIVMILSDTGIFERAERAKYETRKARFEERIGLVNLDALTQKTLTGKLTAEDYFEIVKDHTLINDSSIGGENVKEIGEDEEGNKIYEVTTEEEDVFQVTIDEEGNVETEYKGPSEELAPRILAVKVTEQKTNSITVEVEVDRLNGGKLSYYYKTEDEEKYTELKVNTDDLTATFEELKQDVVYNIKVVAESSKGSDEEVINVRTGKLKEGTITRKSRME